MKTTIDVLAKKIGMDRREFLKVSAQSGALLGATPFLSACHNDDDPNVAKKETRTY